MMYNQLIMKLLLISVILFACTGCGVIPRPSLEKPENASDVMIRIEEKKVFTPNEIEKQNPEDKKSYIIKLEFLEWTKFEGVAQEIQLSDNVWLVEYFKTPNGRIPAFFYDVHHSNIIYEKRKMFVYPANVEGVDYSFNYFAHLPQNLTGSVKTNIGPNFNKRYQDGHQTRGKIVSEDRAKGFYWEFEYNSGTLTIVIPAENLYRE